jgi:hypothetical protein
MPKFFTPAQHDTVSKHLGKVIRGPALEEAMRALDDACDQARVVDADVRRELADIRKRARRIAKNGQKLADDLRADLIELDSVTGMIEPSNDGVYFAPFEHSFYKRLLDVIADAEAWSVARPAKRRGGRPPKSARNRVIDTVRNLYPPEKLKMTRDGHFEKTVNLLLGYIDGQPQKDVHRLLHKVGAKTRARRS